MSSIRGIVFGATFTTLALTLGSVAVAQYGDSTGKSSANSTAEAQVGEPAPDFTLTDLEGNSHTLSDYTSQGKVVVLEWFNPDCPFVQKHHARLNTTKELRQKYSGKNVVWLAINSNAPGEQGSDPERNKKAVEEFGINYPILMDPTSRVARMYNAKTTPQMFIIAPNGALVYDGAIDDNRRAYGEADVNYVDQALGEFFNKGEVSKAKTRPYGCSVKYAG